MNEFVEQTKNLPGELLPLARKVWDAAKQVLGEDPHTGGCQTFYSPEQWKARGEQYGVESKLILVHDGGDFAPLLNLDYGEYTRFDAFAKLLGDDLLIEQCTCWYSAVYNSWK